MIDEINKYIEDKKVNKIVFNIEKVRNIDDDGVDVFINCLSLQSANVDDDAILWAQNLNESMIEKELGQAAPTAVGINDDDFHSIEEDMINLGDVYKEEPNAPITNCFILVKDDDVYDKLYDSGISGLMTIYRTREDFTRDQGVKIAD